MKQYSTIIIAVEDFIGTYHVTINGRPIASFGKSEQDAQKFMRSIGVVLQKNLSVASDEINAVLNGMREHSSEV